MIPRRSEVSRCRRAPELGAWTRAPPRIQTPVYTTIIRLLLYATICYCMI